MKLCAIWQTNRYYWQIEMITFQDFSFGYREFLFEHINLKIHTDQITLLKGENGSGKTTLCRIIAGLERNYQGTVLWQEKNLRSIQIPAEKLIYLKQESAANLVAATPFEDLEIWQTKFLTKLSASQIDSQRKALELFDIADLHQTPFWEMSSGQMKRSALVALALQKTKFWILDEPFAGLHTEIKKTLIAELNRRKKEKSGTLLIAHDSDLDNLNIDRILIIQDKNIEDEK